MKKNALKKEGFDRIASTYGLLENLAFGKSLQKARIAHLKQIKGAREILLAGEGNGRFLEVLLAKNLHCKVTCMDKSQSMLNLAQRRIGNSGVNRVTFQKIDLTMEAIPENKYDALVTHFFLDCFRPKTLLDLLHQLGNSLQHGGKWLLADFVEPNKKNLLGGFQSSILRLLYYFFYKTSGIEAKKVCCPKQIMHSLNMREMGHKSFLRGWITSSTYEKSDLEFSRNQSFQESSMDLEKT